jgi:hypothetical protein
MWQTDIIYYGVDPADYIDGEFGSVDPGQGEDRWHAQATGEFWRDVVG